MTPQTRLNEMKTPMTANSSRSNAMNLINEALSRARWRRSQNVSESRRPARNIAIEARRRQAREMGNW
jgi:hypothetical protein